MNTVFIGGSRRLGRLNSVIRERLDNIVKRGLQVVIGDANGTDRAVQAFLAERLYRDVVVYCMEGDCRNNVGGWTVQSVKAHGKRGFDYYTLKDAEMSRQADCGFMIWDAKSKGTPLNIMRMLESGKPTVVYFAPTHKCSTLRTRTDLNALLEHCSPSDCQSLRKLLGTDWEQTALFVRE